MSTSEKFYNYFKKNTRKIAIIISALVVVAIIGLIVKSVHDSKVARSQEAFHLANDQADPNGREEALEAIRSEYPGTKASRQAAYALLEGYLASANIEEALPLLDELIKTLDSSEESLRPILLASQAGLLEQAGQLDLSLASYQAALALADSERLSGAEAPFVAELYSSLGRVYAALGRAEEARKAYENLILRSPNNYRAFTAQVMLSRLQSPEPSGPGDPAASLETPEGAPAGKTATGPSPAGLATGTSNSESASGDEATAGPTAEDKEPEADLAQ